MEDIDLEETDIIITEEPETLEDLDVIAVQFAEKIEMSDVSDRQSAIESLVESLSPESVSFLKEALGVVI